MNKRKLIRLLAVMLLALLLCGCAQVKETAAPAPIEVAAPAPTEVAAEPVTLTVAGSWPDCRALDVVANSFTAKYPNCTIVYEYVQDYYPSLEKRMSGDEPVDMFITTNIQEESPMLPFALDLYDVAELSLADTFDGLIQNFVFRGSAEDKPRLYAVPLGAEMRGLYVNKTLLESVGLQVPVDQASLLAACQTLKDSGYIPFHGNPGDFAQTLLYPWICSLVANAEDPAAAYARVNAREPGVSEMFREPCAFLYTLVENGYYDYKKAQTEFSLFLDATNEAYARDFLNIQKQNEEWVKADDIGRVAFMPSPMSMGSVVAKTKEDYHSNIDYVFIPAPVGPDGGFAYLSPAHGIAICNTSPNQAWAARFLNYLFEPENNRAFAQAFNIIPNTKEAFGYIRTLFDVPDNRISHLGQVTFDYGFYDSLMTPLMDISKGNNPKYMHDDGSGNLTLYPLEYYMEALEASIQKQ